MSTLSSAPSSAPVSPTSRTLPPRANNTAATSFPRVNWNFTRGSRTAPTTFQFTLHLSATESYNSPFIPVTNLGVSELADDRTLNRVGGDYANDIFIALRDASFAIPNGWERRVLTTDESRASHLASIVSFG